MAIPLITLGEYIFLVYKIPDRWYTKELIVNYSQDESILGGLVF